MDQELEELGRRWATSEDPDLRLRFVQVAGRAEGRKAGLRGAE